MSIHYTIEPIHPEAHLFHVTLDIDSPNSEGQRVSLPAWIPGSYMIRDFSKNIVQIAATSEGRPVTLEKLDKNTWISESNLNTLKISYEVYAWDLSVRTAHLDTTHGFFNGTSVFLCVENQEDQPCLVTLNPPARISNWEVATSLSKAQVNDQGFGQYKADNYDDLIDHPVEMGTFERAVFTACGAEHELVLTGQYTTDIERICQDLKIICEYHIRFFGEPPPVERYVFLVMVVGDGYGGLEHRASTSLLIKREHLPVPSETTISDDYLEFLGLCSHEYFHTWNVKRIKPARFVPYRLDQESHTDLLWAFEGITSYYDDLALVHCGLIDQERYLQLLARIITRVYRGAGRLKQSVSQSSFDAWTKFYKQDENAPNAIVSYYAKGALVAFALDMLIREKTSGTCTLQDLMRTLWKNYLNTGAGVGEREFEQIAGELCGEDVTEFFRQAVYGTEDLDLRASFNQVGINLNFRPAEGQDDRGGTPPATQNSPLTLGVRGKNVGAGFKITHVFDRSPAQQAGISAGDTLIALDYLAMKSATLEKKQARHQAGDQLKAHVFRRDELHELVITLAEAPNDTCYLTIQEDQLLTDAWLSSTPA